MRKILWAAVAGLLVAAAPIPRSGFTDDVRKLVRQVKALSGQGDTCRLCGGCGVHAGSCPAPTALKVEDALNKEQP